MSNQSSATGVITYRTDDGELETWAIHCTAQDTEESVRAHALKCRPGLDIVNIDIIPDGPDSPYSKEAGWLFD